MTELSDFHQKRFVSILKAMVEHLRQHNVEKWAAWFEEDLQDYLAAQGPPRQVARQKAVTEHILMAFGGMSDFTQSELTDASGNPLPEANARLQFLSTQLWAATRSVQGVLASIETN